MARASTALLEWLRPGAVRRPSIRPLEAGLRPNSRLDESQTIVTSPELTPDDVAALGALVFVSSGDAILRLDDAGTTPLASNLGGRVTAMRVVGSNLVAAVEGRGLIQVRADGTATDLSDNALVLRCVTDILGLKGAEPSGSGELLIAVGSTAVDSVSWGQEFVAKRRSGRLVRVHTDGRAELVADSLGWPSGLAQGTGENILVSLSMDHRIEERSTTNLGVPGKAVLENLAGYPGRLRERPGGGWWVAMPYLRNRATELLMSEDEAVADMLKNVVETEWLIPMLRSENVYRDPLQIGQQRVMGQLKPWAPPRTYGLVFRLGTDGRVVESAHSTPDGHRKGVTGVAPLNDGTVVVACQGARAVVSVREMQP